ncbi:biopolymer transporter ExbD [Gammaproteobacteria bacterium AS21]
MRSRLSLDIAEEEAGIDMTPMLDVVFIMLIFFIVSTTFVRDEGVEINRPNASSAQQQKSDGVVVAIDSNGQAWLDQQKLSISMLEQQLQSKIAKGALSSVLIKADRETPTGDLIKILDLIKATGISQVAVATEQK